MPATKRQRSDYDPTTSTDSTMPPPQLPARHRNPPGQFTRLPTIHLISCQSNNSTVYFTQDQYIIHPQIGNPDRKSNGRRRQYKILLHQECNHLLPESYIFQPTTSSFPSPSLSSSPSSCSSSSLSLSSFPSSSLSLSSSKRDTIFNSIYFAHGFSYLNAFGEELSTHSSIPPLLPLTEVPMITPPPLHIGPDNPHNYEFHRLQDVLTMYEDYARSIPWARERVIRPDGKRLSPLEERAVVQKLGNVWVWVMSGYEEDDDQTTE